MWRYLGRVAAEHPHLRKIYVFEPGGRVETRGFEHVDRAVAAGRRMIVFSDHIANWEIGMPAGAQHGISVAQIYRALNNPLMDRMVQRENYASRVFRLESSALFGVAGRPPRLQRRGD
jgi:KDO2-lipid IV(A) lauroyltransferase